jgi:hypothetical protein
MVVETLCFGSLGKNFCIASGIYVLVDRSDQAAGDGMIDGGIH